jgi:ADP-heptose:LPS heptosyltransferase
MPHNPTASHREKILLFRPDHLGDVLHTTPVLYALRQTYPDAHISICVGAWAAPILKGNPDPDEVIICNLPWLDRGPSPSWRPLPGVMRQIRAQQFDCILNFRVAAKAAAFSRLLGGKERWGFNVQKSRWAWTHHVAYSRERHVVDNYMALAKAIGATCADVQFRIFPEIEDLTGVDAFLKNSPPVVVLGVTSGHPQKSWFPDRWAQVADVLVDRGFRVLLNGSPSEGFHVEAVRSHMKKQAENLIGRFSVLQFAGFLRKCAAIVTLDSFPMHLSAAVGIPIVALFGPTNSVMWGPYPGKSPTIVVEPPADIPRNAKAMAWIQPKHVLDAFDRLDLK